MGNGRNTTFRREAVRWMSNSKKVIGLCLDFDESQDLLVDLLADLMFFPLIRVNVG